MKYEKKYMSAFSKQNIMESYCTTEKSSVIRWKIKPNKESLAPLLLLVVKMYLKNHTQFIAWIEMAEPYDSLYSVRHNSQFDWFKISYKNVLEGKTI